MKYSNITEGTFISRPNRFIAYVNINGVTETCHVKNTGRCKELLIPGVKVILEVSDNPSRKTKYDLIAVYKGDILINIDSQAPNKVFYEWVKGSGLFGTDIYVKPECKYKNSRFDFYIKSGDRRIFVEVKGVTLEKDGVLLFPDAPTERGVKHLNELIDAKQNGYEAYVFFIIQTEKCLYFSPNRETHPEFADALRLAVKNGVTGVALTCSVGNDELTVLKEAEIRI
ncbi:MAG: DNA/RNA nuclease SfsA [Clostridia bacterium]|nr:DNA/RNA nuclease SfsA [Clostridia bacterium]